MQILTSTEGHDTSPEVARVEWHIDTGKRDGSKAALKLDVALSRLLLLRLGEAGLDDLAEHLLDLLNSELLCQLVGALTKATATGPSATYLNDINLLDLQIIEDVGDSLEGNQLSSANVLLTL